MKVKNIAFEGLAMITPGEQLNLLQKLWKHSKWRKGFSSDLRQHYEQLNTSINSYMKVKMKILEEMAKGGRADMSNGGYEVKPNHLGEWQKKFADLSEEETGVAGHKLLYPEKFFPEGEFGQDEMDILAMVFDMPWLNPKPKKDKKDKK